MAGEDEKAKAEKIAAAKKRVEQIKKQKAKKVGAPSKKEEASEQVAGATGALASAAEVEEPAEEAAEEPKDLPTSPSQAAPSLSQQSKLRSTSFRKGSISASGPLSPGPFSPDGETAPDIYRKHVARIEELEKENKRLLKESSDAEKRWQKAEEELADLREADGDPAVKKDGQVEKLKNEIAALQRQNSQLQQQVARAGTRHGSSPSVSMSSPPELEAQLASKSATIESMEFEISKLRAQVDRHASGSSAEKEQITALEEKLARAEKAAGLAQRELADLRRNLDRTAEKAVREGSERTSAETKLRSLEHDLADQLAARAELEKKVDGLEKKVTTLTTLHKEQDSRTQALRREKERAEKEARELQVRVDSLDSENIKLRSRRSAEGGGGIDDEGVDELENEDRQRLLKTIRELEAENHDLRRGVWREKRRELEGEGGSPAFQDVDLGGGLAASSGKKPNPGGLGDFITSGINALTGVDDGLLEDDDMDFDEDAFRKAHEEEARKRLERIKEVKRGLKNYEGWRLDLVENRRGGGEGAGEIFEV